MFRYYYKYIYFILLFASEYLKANQGDQTEEEDKLESRENERNIDIVADIEMKGTINHKEIERSTQFCEKRSPIQVKINLSF